VITKNNLLAKQNEQSNIAAKQREAKRVRKIY